MEVLDLQRRSGGSLLNRQQQNSTINLALSMSKITHCKIQIFFVKNVLNEQ